MIYVAEFDYVTGYVDGVSRSTLRMASQGFCTGPNSTPPNTYIDSLLIQPGLMRREAFADRTTGGASRLSVGEMVLGNIDGRYDWLQTVPLDGRPLRVLRGTPDLRYPDDWQVVMVSVLEQVMVDIDQVTLRLRDGQAVLASRPISSSVYAGDNMLPDGLEGTADDLKGKRKPRLFGRALNLAPPCVNTSKLIYQISDGYIMDVVARDRGVELAFDGYYASERVMLSDTNLQPGQYRVWTGGMLRLGSPPALLTCDACEWTAQPAVDNAPARIMQRILTGPGGASPDSVASADVEQLASDAPGACGLWCAGDETVGSVMDRFAQTAGAWWGVDAQGQWHMRQLQAPGWTDAAIPFAEQQIVELRASNSGDASRGVPVWGVDVAYRYNGTVIKDPAGAVSAQYAAFLSQAWRHVAVGDDYAREVHPLAPRLAVDSLYLHQSDALAEALRLQAMHGVNRRWLSVVLRVSAAELAQIDIGTTLILTHPRLGLAFGRAFKVLGLQPDLERSHVSLTLWG